MAITNKQLIASMMKEMSTEFKSRVNLQAMTDREVYELITDYPTLQNEFISTLTNKVIKTTFYSKVFENPLRMLHRGKWRFGDSMEQIFVDMAEKKGFHEHFDGSTSDCEDLINVQKPKVHVNYITMNYKYKYKVTISEEQMETAFYNEYGLSEMVSQILASLTSGCYQDEFQDTKALLVAVANGQKLIEDRKTGLLKALPLKDTEVSSPLHLEEIEEFETNPKILAEKIRALTGRLTFASSKYNMSGVTQWSRKDRLILLTTPEIVAKLDVNVLADAFNVSKSELNIRTILIDELPGTFLKELGQNKLSKRTCYGFLFDEDFLQIYDRLLKMAQFGNGANLTVNHFLHKHGMFANCYFANAMAIVGKEIEEINPEE